MGNNNRCGEQAGYLCVVSQVSVQQQEMEGSVLSFFSYFKSLIKIQLFHFPPFLLPRNPLTSTPTLSYLGPLLFCYIIFNV